MRRFTLPLGMLLGMAVLCLGTAGYAQTTGPVLAIQKTVDYNGDGSYTDSETNYLGEVASWTIVVSNTGDASAFNVVTTDSNGQSYTETELGAGAFVTYTYTTTPTADTTNTATVNGVDALGTSLAAASDTASVIVLLRAYESAWAAQANPGETRFLTDPGQWATYVSYTPGVGTADTPVAFPLFAGQTNAAGSLLAYDTYDGVTRTLFVKFVASGQDSDLGYAEGVIGAWKGLTEYHLQAAATLDGFNAVRQYFPGKGKKAGTYGAPIPGKFEFTNEYEEMVEGSDWIQVDISAMTDGTTPVLLAGHAVMVWMEAMPE